MPLAPLFTEYLNSIALPYRNKCRDIRLDLVRGLALICIYIDHAPGNVLSVLTLHAYGLCDASEVFVLVAGISAAIAYAPVFRQDTTHCIRRVVQRIKTLWLAQIGIAIASISILWLAAYWTGNAAYHLRPTLQLLPADPLTAVAGIVTLGAQPGYLNVLPVYILLLGWLPFMLAMAQRNLLLPLAPSALLWLTAQYGMNMPAFAEPTGWYFNPLAWQFLFTIGVVIGIAQTKLYRTARSQPVMVAAAAYLVFTFSLASPWTAIPALAEWRIADPSWLTHQSKQSLAILRLLNILSLAYVIVYWLRDATWLRHWSLGPISTIGRNGLLAFCLATILDEILVVVRLQGARGFWYQFAVNCGGLCVLWVACARAERTNPTLGRLFEHLVPFRARSSPAKS
jgi:hypothetical protein